VVLCKEKSGLLSLGVRFFSGETLNRRNVAKYPLEYLLMLQKKEEQQQQQQ
jgi:hypothetical protein